MSSCRDDMSRSAPTSASSRLSSWSKVGSSLVLRFSRSCRRQHRLGKEIFVNHGSKIGAACRFRQETEQKQGASPFVIQCPPFSATGDKRQLQGRFLCRGAAKSPAGRQKHIKFMLRKPYIVQKRADCPSGMQALCGYKRTSLSARAVALARAALESLASDGASSSAAGPV